MEYYGEWQCLSDNALVPDEEWRWHSPSPLEDHHVMVTVPQCTRIIRKAKSILTTFRANGGKT